MPGNAGVVRGARRQIPVPVEHRHVLRNPRAGVPAEQMIVVLANLAGAVVVAQVVIVGLRQRSVHQAEDQQRDPRPPRTVLSYQTSAKHC